MVLGSNKRVTSASLLNCNRDTVREEKKKQGQKNKRNRKCCSEVFMETFTNADRSDFFYVGKTLS